MAIQTREAKPQSGVITFLVCLIVWGVSLAVGLALVCGLVYYMGVIFSH